MPTITSASREPCPNGDDGISQSRTEMRTRPTSPPRVPRETLTTTPIGMATPIAPDLIWPSHPDIQETSLFPRDDDPSTVAAGGLDPEERWKIHHLYDIPGVRRPTMDTPDNLRRLAESEALVESLQTMEYLTEFPALEERRDFRQFPPRYGDPHYHPSRLKKNGDGRPRRREEERVPAVGPFPERETRRNVFGQGGFLSPMRRVAEAAHRVPEVQDINITEIPRDPTDTNIMEEENEGQDIIPETSPPIKEVFPLAVGQQTSVRDYTIREPEMVVEHVPL